MPSYRFCRSDDVALLTEAYNRCYRVHFPRLPELTVDGFKRLIREIDLWTSSCMVARSDDELVGVLLATKRDDEALIYCIGVHPQHQRKGHARHMLTSLGQKAAILGPSRLLAEVEQDRIEARGLAEACGFQAELQFVDFVLGSHPAPGPASPLVIPISVDELIANAAFDAAARRCWARSPRTLANRKDALSGLAVASAERIEASLLYEDAQGQPRRRIQAFGCADEDRASIWLPLLMRQCCRAQHRQVVFERVHEAEVAAAELEKLGFVRGEATTGYAATPTPA